MKKCPKCGEKYADYVQDCPSCNVSLDRFEEITMSKQLYNIHQKIIDTPIMKKINDFARRCISKIKVYHITIICIVLVAVISGAYFCGTFKQYTNKSVSATFKKCKSKFEDLTTINEEYKNHQTEKDNINFKISDTQKQLGVIEDFEKKQNDYTLEIQNLSQQVNDLASQKAQKEKTLNDIEYELSQY